MKLVSITYKDKPLIESFIKRLGDSAITFRYFQNRSLDCLKQHLVTYFLIDEECPVAYGHLDKEGNYIWLGLCVIEERKKQGLGKKMLNHLINFAKQNNISNIHLSVDKNNIQAQNLYTKFNFVKIQENTSSIIMNLKL